MALEPISAPLRAAPRSCRVGAGCPDRGRAEASTWRSKPRLPLLAVARKAGVPWPHSGQQPRVSAALVSASDSRYARGKTARDLWPIARLKVHPETRCHAAAVGTHQAGQGEASSRCERGHTRFQCLKIGIFRHSKALYRTTATLHKIHLSSLIPRRAVQQWTKLGVSCGKLFALLAFTSNRVGLCG